MLVSNRVMIVVLLLQKAAQSSYEPSYLMCQLSMLLKRLGFVCFNLVITIKLKTTLVVNTT